MEGILRLDVLLVRQSGFHLYSDHHNLTYIFHPTGHGVSKRASLERLSRWALRLSSIPNCVLHFISGSDNIRADQLTRWGGPAPTTRAPIGSGSTQYPVG